MNSAYFVLIKYLKYHNFLNYFKGYLLKVVLTVLFYFYLFLACACLVGIQRTTLGWMKSIVFLMSVHIWHKGLKMFQYKKIYFDEWRFSHFNWLIRIAESNFVLNSVSRKNALCCKKNKKPRSAEDKFDVSFLNQIQDQILGNSR